MEDFTLELTDADAEFIQEHDLDVQALFEAKLEEKRAMIARKNPEAKIDDEVLAKLSKLIESYEERGRMQAFQTRVHEQSPVSILASTDGNSIEVAVRARVNN